MDGGTLAADVSRRRVLAITLMPIVVVLTTPSMIISYGADGDVYRNIAAAERLAASGHYDPVRLPGSPMFDYLLAALSPWGGHYATNGAVLLFYLVGVVLFHHLARDRPARLLLTALFAFTPVLLKNAVTTMDYIPGLTLLLASYAALMKDRLFAASLLLGLAAGMRVTNLAFVLPAAILIRLRNRPLSDLAIYSSLASILALGFHWRFASALATGTFALTPKPFLRWVHIAGHSALQLWGPVAFVTLLAVVALHTKRLQKLFSREEPVADTAAIHLELSTIVFFGLLFLLLPDEPEYLLPVVPFTYLLLARFVPQPYIRLLTAMILLGGIVSLDMKGGESGRRTVQFTPAPGIVLKDYQQRREWELLRNGIPKIPALGMAVVLVGTDYPLFYRNPHIDYVDLNDYPMLREAFLYRENDASVHRVGARIFKLKNRDIFFVTSLPRHICEDLQRRGIKLFIFSLMAPSYAIHLHGYDPDDLGIERLEVLCKSAFYRTK